MRTIGRAGWLAELAGDLLSATGERLVRKLLRRRSDRATQLRPGASSEAPRIPPGSACDTTPTQDDDYDNVLNLAQPLAAQYVAESHRLLLQPFEIEAASLTLREAFHVRIAIEPGDQPVIRYAYPRHTEPMRTRLCQSLGYMHHVLQHRLSHSPLDAQATIVVDTGDLAERPCSIGYDRARGNEAIGLIPDVHFYMARGYAHLRPADSVTPWADKRAQAIWRGSTTGGAALDCGSIAGLPRYRLCIATQQIRAQGSDGRIDAGFVGVAQARSEADADALRARFQAEGLWRSWLSWNEMCRYRYVIDIDGNAGSWGLFEKLLMGSCVLKVESAYEQWFYKDLEAWIHYVPVERDLSNLDERVSWCLDNSDACQRIAEDGRRLALRRDFRTQMSEAAETIIAAATLAHQAS